MRGGEYTPPYMEDHQKEVYKMGFLQVVERRRSVCGDYVITK
jgi:hypothetical protein